jgi:hypothetical protein
MIYLGSMGLKYHQHHLLISIFLMPAIFSRLSLARMGLIITLIVHSLITILSPIAVAEEQVIHIINIPLNLQHLEHLAHHHTPPIFLNLQGLHPTLLIPQSHLPLITMPIMPNREGVATLLMVTYIQPMEMSIHLQEPLTTHQVLQLLQQTMKSCHQRDKQ